MRHNALDEGEIFDLYAEIVEREGLLKKEATYDLPESLWTGTPDNELDVSLVRIASEHTKLYDLSDESGEDLVGQAHPKGGTHTQLDHKPGKDLGKVETVVEQHKVLKDIAEGTATGKLAALAEGLSKLAGVMDAAGFDKHATAIDAVMQHIGSKISKADGADVRPGMENDPQEADRQWGLTRDYLAGLPGNPAGIGNPAAAESIKADQAVKQTADKQIHNHLQHNETALKNQGAVNAHISALQGLINRYRGQAGMAPIQVDGLWGQETNGALNDFGIDPHAAGTNWDNLAEKIQQAGQHLRDQHAMRNYQAPGVGLSHHAVMPASF